MGRKTWQSIPEKFRPLRGRFNVVLSNSLEAENENYVVKNSLKNALEFLNNKNDIYKIWIIGGSSLYKEAIQDKICDNLFLTKVFEKFEGLDTFIPDPSDFGYEKL